MRTRMSRTMTTSQVVLLVVRPRMLEASRSPPHLQGLLHLAVCLDLVLERPQEAGRSLETLVQPLRAVVGCSLLCLPRVVPQEVVCLALEACLVLWEIVPALVQQASLAQLTSRLGAAHLTLEARREAQPAFLERLLPKAIKELRPAYLAWVRLQATALVLFHLSVPQEEAAAVAAASLEAHQVELPVPAAFSVASEAPAAAPKAVAFLSVGRLAVPLVACLWALPVSAVVAALVIPQAAPAVSPLVAAEV
mmetsp:Transcript_106007/g.183204  ORF Transcript_106007/g.183204 Transcript_106007/m.183204 type:complete len:251 (+) Transcript_106007:570-1322(+)